MEFRLPTLRSVISWAIIIFVGWWVINQPDQAALFVHNIFHLLGSVATKISSALSSFTKRT
jgi:hypothetical protein